MKHHTCQYYDEFVSHLEKELPGFKLKTLAELTNCSTERIRRIRIGLYVFDANDIDVLMKNYQANPMYLLMQQLPMRLPAAMSSIVSEPNTGYLSLREENKLLRENLHVQGIALQDKDKIIALYEKQLNVTQHSGKKRA